MCERVGNAIICRRGSGRNRGQKCSKCRTNAGTFLCDGVKRRPRIEGGVQCWEDYVCSVPLCADCRHARGTGDYCDDCLEKRPRLAL